MRNKMLSLLTALCLMLTMVPAAFAAEDQPDPAEDPAGQVNQLPEIPEDQNVPEAPVEMEDPGVPADSSETAGPGIAEEPGETEEPGTSEEPAAPEVPEEPESPELVVQESQTLAMPDGEIFEIQNAELAPGQDLSAINLEVDLAAPLSNAADAGDIPAAGYDGEGTNANPYRVYTGEGLLALGEKFESTAMKISRIYLVGTIDMTGIDVPKGYIFRNFAGLIQRDPAAGPAVIKGLPANVSLVYNWFMGNMAYFDVDLDGQPSRLARMPGTIGGEYSLLNMQNINVYSGSTGTDGRKTVELTQADTQANYSPFIFTTGGEFTMKNCANYADISSSSYGSVFYGYYPIASGMITFTNCVNYGEITMRHAAMFFGNNTVFPGSSLYAFHQEDPDQNMIQFIGCENRGSIRGSQSAYLFSTRAAGDDAVSDAYEGYLRTMGCNKGTVSVLDNELGMKLYADDQGNLTMKPAAEGKNVDHYVVSVYSYVNVFKTVDQSRYGTTRFGTQETLSNGNTTITLKKYGVCDYPLGTTGMNPSGLIAGMKVVEYDGKHYYWLDSSKPGDFYYKVNSGDEAGIKSSPDIVTLAAYDANGKLLGTVSDETKPAESEGGKA